MLINKIVTQFFCLTKKQKKCTIGFMEESHNFSRETEAASVDTKPLEQESPVNTEEALLPVKQVASRLSVSTRKVWRLVAAREFNSPVKVGASSRWFLSDVQDYFQHLKNIRDRRAA